MFFFNKPYHTIPYPSNSVRMSHLDGPPQLVGDKRTLVRGQRGGRRVRRRRERLCPGRHRSHLEHQVGGRWGRVPLRLVRRTYRVVLNSARKVADWLFSASWLPRSVGSNREGTFKYAGISCTFLYLPIIMTFALGRRRSMKRIRN